jgi:hypothetical protein
MAPTHAAAVETLAAAVRILEQAAGDSPEQWHVSNDESGYYVQTPVHGLWAAYTGNDAGAARFASLIALHDPVTVHILADVLRGLLESAQAGVNPEPGWLAYAETIVLKQQPG